MDYKRINLMKGSTFVLTSLDQEIIDWIGYCLEKSENKTALLTEIYNYVQDARKKSIGKTVQVTHIKYCLMILHLKNKISILNRKKNKRNPTKWRTKIKLL